MDHLKTAIDANSHAGDNMCNQDYFEFNVETTTPSISPVAGQKRKYPDFNEHTKADGDRSPNPKRSNNAFSNEDEDKYIQNDHQQTDTIEYVLFDENFLPVTQHPTSPSGHHQMSTTYVQYSVASGTHSVLDNHNNQATSSATVIDSNTDWTQVDLIDLDQRHEWYFQETPSANISSDSLETSTGSIADAPISNIGAHHSVAPINHRSKSSTDGDLFCLRPTQVVESSEARDSVAALSKNMPSKYIHVDCKSTILPKYGCQDKVINLEYKLSN